MGRGVDYDKTSQPLWKRLHYTHDLVYDMMGTFYFRDKIDKAKAFLDFSH